jgi:SPP1 gp7 family putative phage head morphogenesis protein
VFASLTDAQQLDYIKALRLGRAIGETVDSLTARLAPLLDKAERDTRFLVNTSVQSVANAARERVMLDNADVAGRITYVSTLDNKTCPVCGFRDNKQWVNNKTHDQIGDAPPYLLPPVHINCRCTIIPDVGINVIGGTRASMDGAVLETSFESYARRKGKDFMDNHFGVGRTEMLLEGKITYQQLFDNMGNLKTRK